MDDAAGFKMGVYLKNKFSDSIAMSIPCKKTKQAFFWSFVLSAPFYAMYSLLPFIFYQVFNASLLQISLFFSIRPIVSLLSVVWSSLIHKRPDRLVHNVVFSTLLSYLPFLFFPWAESAWFIIFASTIYILMERGAKPAWMEILKLRFEQKERQHLFSLVSTLSHIGAGVLCLLFGSWLDIEPSSFRYLYPLVATLALLPIFLQFKIPIKRTTTTPSPSYHFPWKKSWTILTQRPDFRWFQWGFFLGGAAIMVIQPALPTYFITELNLSYTELGVALTLCKGIGYALSSRQWAHEMSRKNLFTILGYVTLMMALVCFCLVFAKWQTSWVYLAYLAYGVMQAGSEITWHLSGPIFSKDEDSSTYTQINIMMIGLRGLFAPALGGLIMSYFGALPPILFGALLCLSSTYFMWNKQKFLQEEIA